MKCITTVHTSTCMTLAPDSQCFESPRFHPRLLEGCKHLYSMYISRAPCMYVRTYHSCEQIWSSHVSRVQLPLCSVNTVRNVLVTYKITLQTSCWGVYSKGPGIGHHTTTWLLNREYPPPPLGAHCHKIQHPLYLVHFALILQVRWIMLH